ncbi:MAG: hypothetical protein CM1200mP35_09540 [Chloroflexota bacterium]|nr:MAG: hypothetical protein CM1200mP35_09540 [Chloroflexota bacterium]
MPLEIAHTRVVEPGFWDWAQIKGLNGINNSQVDFSQPIPGGGGEQPELLTHWFGQSLDYTITEFPLFSFILGIYTPMYYRYLFLFYFYR